MTQDSATANEDSEAFVYILLEYEEPYCDWCKQPCALCNCDGGIGDNWLDLYFI
jgi:hypothetical protein